jgi:hypothetical protein
MRVKYSLQFLKEAAYLDQINPTACCREGDRGDLSGDTEMMSASGVLRDLSTAELCDQ